MSVLGKYPFLSQARELARARGIERVGYEELELAQRRVVDSVERAVAKDFAAPSPPSEQQGVLSYALARLLLALVDSEYYWQKFARGEALLAMRYLANEPPQAVLEIARDFFPSLKEVQGAFEIPLLEFLSSGSGLSKTQLSEGVVKLSKPALFALLRSSIARRARGRPSASAGDNAFFKEAAEELRLMLPKPLITITEFKGSFLALPCIQSILRGVEEGKRYYASMALAIACRKDGLPKEKALELMQQFVENSRKQTHAFTIREAQASLDWVYRRASVNFNCNSIRSHGLAPEECAFPCTHDRARKRG